MPDLTIGKIAAAAGVGVETVRFYERKGLLVRPRRPANGFRSYSIGAVARILFIRHAKQLGFSLEEIRELLALRSDPSGGCAKFRASAAAKLQDVQSRIRSLSRLERVLRRLIGTCPGAGNLEGCSILMAIEAPRRGLKRVAFDRVGAVPRSA